jgi:hypothetical protein
VHDTASAPAVHKKQAVMFGGVTDHEKDRGEIIVSEFYNEAYTFQARARKSPGTYAPTEISYQRMPS